MDYLKVVSEATYDSDDAVSDGAYTLDDLGDVISANRTYHSVYSVALGGNSRPAGMPAVDPWHRYRRTGQFPWLEFDYTDARWYGKFSLEGLNKWITYRKSVDLSRSWTSRPAGVPQTDFDRVTSGYYAPAVPGDLVFDRWFRTDHDILLDVQLTVDRVYDTFWELNNRLNKLSRLADELEDRLLYEE